MEVKIIRKPSTSRRHYPKSGNFDTQAISYDWLVEVDGRVMENLPMLKHAKDAAKSYGESNPKIVR